MQTQFGNQGMLKLLTGGTLQRKLAVNQPGDAYEQEADRMADTVMRMTRPAAVTAPLTTLSGSARLRRCTIGKSSGGGEHEEYNARFLHRKEASAASSSSATAPPIVQEVLGSPGHPLDAVTRTFMEPRFGSDFSDVRVHSNSQAAESAEALNARAYTVGRHIAFGQGQYSVNSNRGRRLLAHELSHVLQQRGVKGEERIQRATQEQSGDVASCDAPTSVPHEQWTTNPTLNRIRANSPGDNRVLVSRGQKGDHVQLIQQAVMDWGCQEKNRNLLPRFGADADFGPETEGAVREFQSAVGIARDGIVGPITLSRLDAFVAFGAIPEFSEKCKVIPLDVPFDVTKALADLGFATSPEFAAAGKPASEQAISAGIAGIPILCQVGGTKGGGGGQPSTGLCGGKAQSVATMGGATFALCDFIDHSRMTPGAIATPGPGNEAGFVEMRALGIRLFGTVQATLPNSGPGSDEMDWQHGFIQTVQSLKYTATYQRGWSSVHEVSSAERDATGSSVSAPWNSNQSIPNFSVMVGKTLITIPGPIALGPEFIGTDPVGIIDDPRVIFVDTVPINSEPECPCSFLQEIDAKGELDTWLVVTPTGKGQTLTDLSFLKHVSTKFDLKADKASNFAVQGTPTMTPENGRGTNTPVLTGTLANDDLRTEKITKGAACPVTIKNVKCPVESPKRAPNP